MTQTASTKAVRLPLKFIKKVERAAKKQLRSIPKQIEYWGIVAEAVENSLLEQHPDLTRNSVQGFLLGHADFKQGKVRPYVSPEERN